MRSLVQVQNGPLENTESNRKARLGNSGDIAQLVERLLCTQEVRSSNLLISTKLLTKSQRKQSESLATYLVQGSKTFKKLERLLNSSESEEFRKNLENCIVIVIRSK